MSAKSIPTPKELRKLLVCDAEAGSLWWRERGVEWFEDTASRTAKQNCAFWNAKYVGKRAFTTLSYGYLRGRIDGRMYLAHRVIFAIVMGAWPVNELDHADHDRANNSFGNLKDVTHAQNHKNRSIPLSNTSGVMGVSWCSDRGKWRARIDVERKRVCLGHYIQKSDAILARRDAEKKYGFHDNHGNR